MKLPRGVSADRLIRALEHIGDGVIRQKGSHGLQDTIHLSMAHPVL